MRRLTRADVVRLLTLVGVAGFVIGVLSVTPSQHFQKEIGFWCWIVALTYVISGIRIKSRPVQVYLMPLWAIPGTAVMLYAIIATGKGVSQIGGPLLIIFGGIAAGCFVEIICQIVLFEIRLRRSTRR